MKRPLAQRALVIAALFVCATMMSVAVFAGCGGLRDWSRAVSGPYGFASPWSGMVCITREGGLDGSVQKDDETVANYWNQGEWLAVELERYELRPSGGRSTPISNPFVLINTRTDKWTRFATEAELLSALPAGTTAGSWGIPSPPCGCVCCSAVILPLLIAPATFAPRRQRAALDRDLFVT